MSIQTNKFKQLYIRILYFTVVSTLVMVSNVGYTGPLDLSNTVLEVSTGVEPNIIVLNDDSGSMDWGLMTPEREGRMHLPNGGTTGGNFVYYYAHPDNGVTTGATPPASNASFFVMPSEDFLNAQGVAAPYLGVWRARNVDYNKVYYNPETTYKPWAGVDNSGTTYADASATNALYNPYDAAQGGLDLTTTHTYSASCVSTECTAAGLPGWSDEAMGIVFVFNNTDYYPARYYTWTDTDTDGDVDDNDSHQLIEIRTGGCTTGASCPATFTRSIYNSTNETGRSDCSIDNGNGTVTCSYAEEMQNFANWFQYYRKRDLVAKAALSNVIDETTLARIGYATLHDNNSVATQVSSMNLSPGSGNKKSLLDNIFSTRPSGGTPLRENFEQVGRYFECEDGDIFGSTSDSTPGSSGCPIEAAPNGTCQQNFAILMTDGFYNGSDPGVSDEDGDDDTNFDNGAFADDYSDTLADIAMEYYENDLHSSLANDVPTTNKDVSRYPDTATTLTLEDTMHQHMATYSVGFGVEGTLSTMPSDPTVVNKSYWPDPDDGDPEKIDDLRHAAYNGRGSFTSANNPEVLANTLEEIFDEIGTGEGAASSVAFNSQTIEADSVVFRAFFNTQDNTGSLVAQRINFNGTLNVDTNGDPIFEWNAAEELDNKTGASSDSRVIITYDDNGASSQGVAFKWAGSSKITGPRNNTSTQMYALDQPVPANVSDVGDERLNYLRGHSVDEGPTFDDGEFRIRPLFAGKLGDIVHSTPVYVGQPSFTGRISGAFPGEFPSNVDDLYTTFKSDNANRTSVVYVGANDGMLHAFKATDGEELFAYVPNILFDELSELTDPDYDHRFYVDLTPSINDVFMKKSGSTDASWNTVLVGGLGAGGKGYYALNITDPSAFTTETNAAQNVMWEFTEADDGIIGNSDLGYSFSAPLLAMSNADINSDGEKDWVAIFGNGFNSTSTDGDAAIYMAFLEAGQDGVWTSGSDYIKISTGYGKAESSDGTTPNGIGGVRGIDIDGDGTVDQLYAGDLQGNLYRVDVSSTNPSQWDDSSNRDVLFKARYGTSYPRTAVQPIINRPIVVKNKDEGGYIVIVATGSWMTSDDSTSTDIQSIYGIWDNGTGNEVLMVDSDNQLVEQIFTNHTSKEHGFTVRSLTNNAINWKDTGSTNNKVMGWYIDLDMPAAGLSSGVEYPGERAVRNLQLRGDFLFVNTIIPKSSNPCNTGAGGFELAFNPLTGGSGSDFIFDINADGTFDLDDNINDTAGDAYIVAGIRFDDTTPTDAAFIGKYRVTQQSDKTVRSIGTNTEATATTGRNSWRELIVQ